MKILSKTGHAFLPDSKFSIEYNSSIEVFRVLDAGKL